MNIDALRDLELAGVEWELTDGPCATASNPPRETPTAAGATGTPRATPTVVPAAAPIGPDAAVTAANAATDIAEVIRALNEFPHPLRMVATNTVLPHIGTPGHLMIITDTPGADDDTTGRILSGPAGDMMDKMMAAIGLTRDAVSIVSLVAWRTPGGRTPTRAELDLMRPFVDRLVELTRPRVILTLGTLAAAEMAGRALPREHGNPATRDDGIIVMPIYHPNFLVLKPDAKRDVWNALQSVQNMLKDAEK